MAVTQLEVVRHRLIWAIAALMFVTLPSLIMSTHCVVGFIVTTFYLIVLALGVRGARTHNSHLLKIYAAVQTVGVVLVVIAVVFAAYRHHKNDDDFKNPKNHHHHDHQHPTDPTNPTDPVDPTDPTDPVAPTDPTDPVLYPIDPLEPVDPDEDPQIPELLEPITLEFEEETTTDSESDDSTWVLPKKVDLPQAMKRHHHHHKHDHSKDDSNSTTSHHHHHRKHDKDHQSGHRASALQIVAGIIIFALKIRSIVLARAMIVLIESQTDSEDLESGSTSDKITDESANADEIPMGVYVVQEPYKIAPGGYNLVPVYYQKE